MRERRSTFTKYMRAFNEHRSFSALMHPTGWQHKVSGSGGAVGLKDRLDQVLFVM